MFTLQQIKDAHSKVKSGADFPRYIEELIELVVFEYTLYVYDGHAEYKGKDDYKVISEAKYPILVIAESVDVEAFKQYLKMHQQGKTDYVTFCEDSAKTGVYKWVVNLITKTCTYYSKSDQLILKEIIPL